MNKNGFWLTRKCQLPINTLNDFEKTYDLQNR